MTAFPYYSAAFYPKQEKNTPVISDADQVKTLYIGIEGMTCTGCEEHIRQAVNPLKGVFKVDASYKESSATIEFDPAQTSIEDIKEAIGETGYTVTGISEAPNE
ncbi:MAG TPA: copper chaperone [Phaeodactylibacter sp.]|nr:copper chaperone [Phaeodactylibacter sp.]